MGTCSQTLSFRQDIELKHHKEHISSNMVQKGYTPRIYHNLTMFKKGLKCRLVSCIQTMEELIKICWNQASIVTIYGLILLLITIEVTMSNPDNKVDSFYSICTWRVPCLAKPDNYTWIEVQFNKLNLYRFILTNNILTYYWQNMHNVRHIVKNSGHTTWNDGHTMQNVGHTTHCDFQDIRNQKNK